MNRVADLSVHVEPLDPEVPILDVGDLFLQPQYDGFLSLPVVKDGEVIGNISRYHVQKILMGRYGRELKGKRPVSEFMNASPLQVQVEHSVEEASRYVAHNISYPIVEDFILTEGGRYHGVGSVIDLLHAIESRLTVQNDSLAQSLRRLRESQSQLVQSEKMASLGQMVAGVAHEINTPLGYVKNNVELAQMVIEQMRVMQTAYDDLLAAMQSPQTDETSLQQCFAKVMQVRTESVDFSTDEMKTLFTDTLYGLDQIGELVTNLRNFSRLDRVPVDDVNINDCVESTLKIAHNLLKNKVEVIRKLSDVPPVSCAPSQINQVILNLLTNAAQAIEDRGRIIVSTSFVDDYVHIVVKDTGKGIAQEHLNRIFDPFFTTKQVGKGTGLGLSISQKIVQDHAGLIRVKSKPGVGTAFCVSLPVRRIQQP